MSFVYFLRPIGMDGPVKIGFSQAPRSRLESYMPWSPYPLELAAKMEGGAELERSFHAHFARLRTHHEWFSADPELTAAIQAVADGSFVVDSLPDPRRLPRRPRASAKWSDRARMVAGWGQRFRRLNEQGVKVPDAVESARYRYHWGRYRGAVEGLSSDRAIIEGFLADHPPVIRAKRAA